MVGQTVSGLIGRSRQPGHEKMVIGLSQFRDYKLLTLPRLLALPFVGDPGFYSRGIKRRQPKSRD